MQVEERLLKQAQESGQKFDTGELQLSSQTQEAALSGEEVQDSSSEMASEALQTSSDRNEQDVLQDRSESSSGQETAEEIEPLSETERYMMHLAQEASETHDKSRTPDHSEL